MPPAPQLDPKTVAIEKALSQPRLGPYLAACSGNHKAALRLYHWNINLSGAMYEALHVFEVTFRNALDAQLCTWNSAQLNPTGQKHSPDWLMDPNHLLQRLAGEDIRKAKNRARAALRTGRPGGRTPGHADVLAQLTFGTWRYLLPDNDPGRQLLWNQALSNAFPHLTETAAALVARVNGIYKLRNRVAHLEPLLRRRAVRQELDSMRWVLNAMEPHLEQWFTSRQRVTPVLRARP